MTALIICELCKHPLDIEFDDDDCPFLPDPDHAFWADGWMHPACADQI